MAQQTDSEYYASRGLAEQELSRKAKDPAAAEIHGKLSRRYAKLAREVALEVPPARAGKG